MTIAEWGSELDVMVKATPEEGNQVSSHYTVPAAGGEGEIMESPYEAVSSKRMGPNGLEISLSKRGQIVYTTGIGWCTTASPKCEAYSAGWRCALIRLEASLTAVSD